MKIYFITYGNEKFKYSVKRICKEADSLKIFNKVLFFTENDLPLSIKSSPLFSSSKGGGLWLWKPYIINKVLEEINEGDVVVYSDAGNELIRSHKWNEYIKFLDQYNSIFFQYKENFDYGWNKFNSEFNDSPKLKYWIKKNSVEHFGSLFTSDNDWLEKSKIIAGLIFIKKSNQSHEMIKEWLSNMLFFPHLVFDLFEGEKFNQIEGFSQNRHDQSILSVLVRFYEKSNNFLVLDEQFETLNDFQILRTSRKVDKKKSFVVELKKIIKRIVLKLKIN